MTLRESTLPFPAHERTDSTTSDTRTLTGTLRDYDTKRESTLNFDTKGKSSVKYDTPRQSAVDLNYTPPPAYIPSILGKGRMLVLCFDGTAERFDDDNSNIVDFFSLLKRDDPSQQVVYYQIGLGTTNNSHFSAPFLTKLSQGIDMMVAWGLGWHISNGYKFLMKNYRPKDKICIFGFSRGAYIARCLAGMLNKVGLLPAANVHQISHAYELFRNSDSERNWKTCNSFKRTFCIDVDIHFLGVWDTVSSVGIINARRLPFTTSNTIIRTFRHAISLDERRARFQVKTWSTSNAHDAKLGVVDQEIQLKVQLAKEKAIADSNAKGKGKDKDKDKDKGKGKGKEKDKGKGKEKIKEKKKGFGKTRLEVLGELEKKYGVERTRMTDVQEVWFAGTHTDVGGGSVKNGVRPNLAHIPLRWMIREIFKTDTGIIFNSLALARLGMDPNALYPVVRERADEIPIFPSDPADFIQEKPKHQVAHDTYEVSIRNESYQALLAESEEERDKRDALGPLYDRLRDSIGWKILELLPMRYEEEDNGIEYAVWRPWNLGRGRAIPNCGPNQKVKVHRTVRTRLEARYADGKKYVPSATNFNTENVQWVD